MLLNEDVFERFGFFREINPDSLSVCQYAMVHMHFLGKDGVIDVCDIADRMGYSGMRAKCDEMVMDIVVTELCRSWFSGVGDIGSYGFGELKRYYLGHMDEAYKVLGMLRLTGREFVISRWTHFVAVQSEVLADYGVQPFVAKDEDIAQMEALFKLHDDLRGTEWYKEAEQLKSYVTVSSTTQDFYEGYKRRLIDLFNALNSQ